MQQLRSQAKIQLPNLADRSAWGQLWMQWVAIVMVINLALVAFNSSYLTLRDLYWHYWPALVEHYDPIKGVQPYPSTVHYLNTVDDLERQVAQTGLQSPQTQAVLQDLRSQSAALMDENPFLIANKMASFAKFKRQIRQYTDTVSTQAAFERFWTADFLAIAGWSQSREWIDAELRPLLATNYYRIANETGLFVDRFWLIDIYFVFFFAVEMVGRAVLVSRRVAEINWLDALVRRWYDWLLLIPVWRWLRILPTVVRVHQSRLVNMERFLAQATHEPAAYLADRVSKFLLVRLVNQTQTSVQSGALIKALIEPEPHTAVGEADKLGRLSDRLIQLVIYKAMPTIQPNLEGLLRHSLRESLQQSDLYQGMQIIPGISTLPKGAAEQLADYLAAAACDVLVNAYEDEQGRQLFDQLSQDFRYALTQELKDEGARNDIQQLLGDWLEELKLNYLEQAAEVNPEDTLSEAEALQEKVTAKKTENSSANAPG